MFAFVFFLLSFLPMATSGQGLDAHVRERIVHFLKVGYSRRQIVKACGVCKRTVDKIAREEQDCSPVVAVTRSVSEESAPHLLTAASG